MRTECNHEIDVTSITVTWDGDQQYIDAKCVHCQMECSLGALPDADDLDWTAPED